MAEKLTAAEVADSVKGRELLVIADQFGRTFADMMSNDPVLWGYSLVFVVKLREGIADLDAYAQAMELTIAECQEFFAPAADGEAAGKEQKPEEKPQESLPASV